MGEALGPPTPLAEAGDCDLNGFSCGEPTLDDWLKRRARASEGRHARTYLLLSGTRAAAYYCVSAGSVLRADMPSAKYRRNAPDLVPILVLGKLAVDSAFQGRGLGSDLLSHCLRQSLATASLVGIRALVVHPLNDRAALFYRALGFLPLGGSEPTMFMPIETIEQVLAPKG